MTSKHKLFQTMETLSCLGLRLPTVCCNAMQCNELYQHKGMAIRLAAKRESKGAKLLLFIPVSEMTPKRQHTQLSLHPLIIYLFP